MLNFFILRFMWFVNFFTFCSCICLQGFAQPITSHFASKLGCAEPVPSESGTLSHIKISWTFHSFDSPPTFLLFFFGLIYVIINVT